MNTDKLVAHSRVRFEHAAARRTLKEKYEAKLVFAYNGGMFKAGPELISIIGSTSTGRSILVLQDLYGNPVKVDKAELRSIVIGLWQDTMDQWLVEYEELNKKR
jgi:hypothetical protein